MSITSDIFVIVGKNVALFVRVTLPWRTTTRNIETGFCAVAFAAA